MSDILVDSYRSQEHGEVVHIGWADGGVSIVRKSPGQPISVVTVSPEGTTKLAAFLNKQAQEGFKRETALAS